MIEPIIMYKQEPIFTNMKANNQSSMMFFAAFHLSIPLAIYTTKSSKGWSEIRQELLSSFAREKDKFSIIERCYNSEFINPLGKFISLRSETINHVFQIETYLQQKGVFINERALEIDNFIWIFPSGVVLIGLYIGSESQIFDLDTLRIIVGERYAELTFIFNQVASTIYSTIGVVPDNSILCGISNYRLHTEAIKLQENQQFNTKQDIELSSSWLAGNQTVRTLYDAILIDVYFIEFNHFYFEPSLRIDYRDSTIVSDDYDYVLAICSIYASFVNLIWLHKILNENAQNIQDNHVKQMPYQKDASSSLRLLRIHALQFINQSMPTSICLIRGYVLIMETCWTEFRMHQFVNNINGQLGTLEAIIIAIEANKSEARNFKIGLAALFIGLISVIAVAAQLIDTIDINSNLAIATRIQFIVLGFFIGITSITMIYLFPFTKSKL